MYLYLYLSFFLSIYLSICLFIYLSIYLSIYLYRSLGFKGYPKAKSSSLVVVASVWQPPHANWRERGRQVWVLASERARETDKDAERERERERERKRERARERGRERDRASEREKAKSRSLVVVPEGQDQILVLTVFYVNGHRVEGLGCTGTGFKVYKGLGPKVSGCCV